MNKYDNQSGSLAIDSLLNYETVKVWLDPVHFSVLVLVFAPDATPLCVCS